MAREDQRVGYWLTPAGCQASGGHTWHEVDGRTSCTVCGITLVRVGGAL